MSLQSCLTLCDPTGCSPPGSSVHGILQARILGVGSLDLGPILNPGWSHLKIPNLMTPAKTLFSNKVTFTGATVRMHLSGNYYQPTSSTVRAKISHQLPRLHGAEKDEEDGLPREGRRWGGSEISRDKGAIRLHSPLETPFTEEETARKVAAPQRSHSGQTSTSNPSAPGASHIPTHLSGPSRPSIQGSLGPAWGMRGACRARPGQLAGLQVQGRRPPGPAFGSAKATSSAPSRSQSPAPTPPPTRVTTLGVGVFHAPPLPSPQSLNA